MAVTPAPRDEGPHSSVGLTRPASSLKVAHRLPPAALRRRRWPSCAAQMEPWRLAPIPRHSRTYTCLRKADSNPQTCGGTDYESCTTSEAASCRYSARPFPDQSARTFCAEVSLERGCRVLCPRRRCGPGENPVLHTSFVRVPLDLFHTAVAPMPTEQECCHPTKIRGTDARTESLAHASAAEVARDWGCCVSCPSQQSRRNSGEDPVTHTSFAPMPFDRGCCHRAQPVGGLRAHTETLAPASSAGVALERLCCAPCLCQENGCNPDESARSHLRGRSPAGRIVRGAGATP